MGFPSFWQKSRLGNCLQKSILEWSFFFYFQFTKKKKKEKKQLLIVTFQFKKIL